MTDFDLLMANLGAGPSTSSEPVISGGGDYFQQVALKAAVDAIPQLTEENYSIWRDKVLLLLDLKQVKEAIVNSEGPLSAKDNREVRAILISKLDSVTHCNVVTSHNL